MKNLTLCLDVGNSNIVAGVFAERECLCCFRYETQHGGTSDQLGVFLRSVLRENDISYQDVNEIAIASVVPGLNYSLIAACKKYFAVTPFMLQPGVKTGLKIKYKNPTEVGADLIAGSVAACELYPGDNLIVIDFGTATTFCAITNEKEFLGGLIMPGLRLSAEALQNNTAKLPAITIVKPDKIIGDTVTESIQAGIYFSQLAAIKEIVANLQKTSFNNSPATVVATGGFAHLFLDSGLFAVIRNNLVLEGILSILLRSKR
ncbi:MAG: type III pantothenate kinase [Gammaproteobacteria bacterium]|nr:type III pantothenate kinase [Gammaproteobacteria bacterium]